MAFVVYSVILCGDQPGSGTWPGSGCCSELQQGSLNTTEKAMLGEESSSLCCCRLLDRTSSPLWTTANVRTLVASSKDTQRLSLQASSPQLLKGTEILALVMLVLQLLGQ